MKKLLTVALFVARRAARSLRRRGSAALSPFAGNVGNAIWTLVIFVIVVVVLGKFAWGPVLALLQQREEFIHKSLSDAKQRSRRSGSAAEGVRREAPERAGRGGGDHRGSAHGRRAAARGTPRSARERGGRHDGQERRAADSAADRHARSSRSGRKRSICP